MLECYVTYNLAALGPLRSRFSGLGLSFEINRKSQFPFVEVKIPKQMVERQSSLLAMIYEYSWSMLPRD